MKHMELVAAFAACIADEATPPTAAHNLYTAIEKSIKALTLDAERYRWLKGYAAFSSKMVPTITIPKYENGRYTGEHTVIFGEKADAAIDLEMK